MDHDKTPEKAGRAIHDGERVRLQLQGREMAQSDFAGGMRWETSKVSRMLQQESWRAADLARAGKLLDFDFFREYRAILEPDAGDNPQDTVTATLFLPLSVELSREVFDTAQRHLRGYLGMIAGDPAEK